MRKNGRGLEGESPLGKEEMSLRFGFLNVSPGGNKPQLELGIVRGRDVSVLRSEVKG